MAQTSENVVMPLAEFPQGISADFLFQSDTDPSLHSKEYGEEIEVLKEQVKAMVLDTSVDHKGKLGLINIIDRLGVSHYFEKEIGNELESIFHIYNFQNDFDLYTVGTHFRVFRQHGHKMSSDVFNKFKDNNGKLEHKLKGDVKGILSLYEASHVMVHGEEFLEEALEITTAILGSIASESNLEDRCLYNQVVHATKQPLHMGIKRLESTYFISFYGEDESRNETLLRLAKMDFNMLQLLHRQELTQIVKWWNELNVKTHLPYVRNRSIECHFWAMTLNFDAFHSCARLLLAKLFNILTILDDTYDSYGTIEELRLLTQAFERWDKNSVDELPEKMKLVFHITFNLFEEFEKEMPMERRDYVTRYAKKTVLDWIRGVHTEAEWGHLHYIPSLEEYMWEAARDSSGNQPILTTFMLGMEATIVDEKAFEWIINPVPPAIRGLEAIGRLSNDIVSHEREQMCSVHVASAVECYMNEHGASEDEAVIALQQMIKDAWKDINEELVKPNNMSVSPLIRNILINLGRSYHHYYKEMDGYTHSKEVMKDVVVLVYGKAYEDVY